MAAESRFEVMGSKAHVLVVAADGAEDAAPLVDAARDRLDELERRWSRFLPDSEMSHVNRAAPNPVVVSADTCALVIRAMQGWRSTGGLFDPTVLGDVVRAGYDRSFASIPARTRPGSSDRHMGCAGIVVDEYLRTVRLPDEVGFDPGGIGKGFAADLVVEELMRRGAHGACVNVGGDVRVAGSGPSGAWRIDVLDPFDHEPMDVLTVGNGAVATSTRTKRQWAVDGRPAHHLIDPSTGRPASTGLAAVTVLAGNAARAEVLAKAAFVAGPVRGSALLDDCDAPGLLVDDDGGHMTTPAWSRFCTPRQEGEV